MAKTAMTDNALKVWEYLKANEGTDMTAADIAIGMGMCDADDEDAVKAATKSMNGILTGGLQKKGYTKRVEATIEVEEDGKTTVKAVKFIELTDAGKNYDHEAAIAADIEAAKAE